ncbi:hypothetical protein [Endozoicomonas arenosclerae]|uniref:hypothetical protein n=1 Tax=Endozoicomonas arenosclerae TaxID=1633495 RepID=UPI000781285D|nr:hypothetical protein [Endozoicomonas arenosclerae]
MAATFPFKSPALAIVFFWAAPSILQAGSPFTEPPFPGPDPIGKILNRDIAADLLPDMRKVGSPLSCVLQTTAENLRESVLTADKSGYSCLIAFTGKAILKSPLHIHDHQLLGLDSAEGFQPDSTFKISQNYQLREGNTRAFFIIDPAQNMAYDHRTATQWNGAAVIAPSTNFIGESLIIFSGESSIQRVVIERKSPGCTILDLSYRGPKPQSLKLTDILWEDSPSLQNNSHTPRKCHDGQSASNTQTQQQSAGKGQSATASVWSLILSACSYCFGCCGRGNGGGDDDPNRDWRIQQRLRENNQPVVILITDSPENKQPKRERKDHYTHGIPLPAGGTIDLYFKDPETIEDQSDFSSSDDEDD